MKTVGELLTAARKSSGLTLEDLSRKTHIDPRYLEALESDNLSKLPSPTFTKGFIRNVSLVLGKNPDEMIALYRRDFQKSKPTFKKPPSRFSLAAPLPYQQLALVVLGALFFFGYLAFQYRAVITPPKLTVTKPASGSVLSSPVAVEGSSTVDSVITINQSKDINTDQSGHFATQFPLSPGDATVTITATNRYGRTTTVNIPITVISQ